MHSHHVLQVLNVNTDRSAVNKESARVLDGLLQHDNVYMKDDGQDDFEHMPLQQSLPMLCKQSEAFKEALRFLLLRAGLGPHACTTSHAREHACILHMCLLYMCGDDRMCFHVVWEICDYICGPRASVRHDSDMHSCAGPIWNLVLYCDGITPGNVIAPENKRKAFVFYCAFLEFFERLCCTELWIPIAVVRTRCCTLG